MWCTQVIYRAFWSYISPQQQYFQKHPVNRKIKEFVALFILSACESEIAHEDANCNRSLSIFDNLLLSQFRSIFNRGFHYWSVCMISIKNNWRFPLVVRRKSSAQKQPAWFQDKFPKMFPWWQYWIFMYVHSFKLSTFYWCSCLILSEVSTGSLKYLRTINITTEKALREHMFLTFTALFQESSA